MSASRYCFLAKKAHELPLSTSLGISYFSVIDFEASFLLCPGCDILPTTNVLSCINPQRNTVKRLYILFEKVFVLFFNAMSSNSNFFASYLGSHCNEVPLKRSFLFNGPKKLVPLSESPTYPESQLIGVFLVKFSKEVQGTKENGLS